ncbi:(Fe-S)-cluster assembly protein [Humibacter albus]|jgi:Fe-S cluster assembly iron-binding protein IscA|uniref:(Fe-S)-cluster assembly protein n=1 Tax=Humibacter albus TaxID=427754 RepID=UPI0003B67883|nr:(Fe-S)-cluster assembly protein [Humibacter albus]
MLTLTDNASTIVKTLTTQAVDSAEGGLRISSPDPATSSFAVTVAPAPETADQVIVDGDARVFVDESASAALDDKVLDAQLDDQGAVHFQLGLQSPA